MVSPQQDVILFIEEVEESLHAIDRLFYMLRLQFDFDSSARYGNSRLLWFPRRQQQLSSVD